MADKAVVGAGTAAAMAAPMRATPPAGKYPPRRDRGPARRPGLLPSGAGARQKQPVMDRIPGRFPSRRRELPALGCYRVLTTTATVQAQGDCKVTTTRRAAGVS